VNALNNTIWIYKKCLTSIIAIVNKNTLVRNSIVAYIETYLALYVLVYQN
jgi:hypothetical protein